jgi:hypothetical protein
MTDRGNVALDVTALQIEAGSSGSASSDEPPIKRGYTFAEKGMTITLKVSLHRWDQIARLHSKGVHCHGSLH